MSTNETPTKSKFAQDDDDGSSVDSGELSEEDTKRPTESSTRITFSNVGPITLTRQFFAKYCHYPQFESAITGCFTRVRVSEKENDYRFARIEGLVTVSKYTVEGAPVDQGLELSQGSSKKVINMDFASNSLITEVKHE
jgi:RNA polymerase-associated protein RTF1